MQQQPASLMRMDRRATRGGYRAHRGMSLLEVVFAVALLGMVVASIASLFGFATNYQLRERQRLAAAEVAHRLLLSYLDDPSEMPDPSMPVEYGPPEAPARFRWEYREDPVGLIEVGGDQRDASRQSPLRSDRFRLITVRVWLSEESGGSRTPDGGTPSVTLARMIDPVAIRNPDSALHMLSTERGQRRWIEAMGMIPGANIPGGQAGQQRLNRTPGSGAWDAFQRGPGGQGGQRMPMDQFRQRQGGR